MASVDASAHAMVDEVHQQNRCRVSLPELLSDIPKTILDSLEIKCRKVWVGISAAHVSDRVVLLHSGL